MMRIQATSNKTGETIELEEVRSETSIVYRDVVSQSVSAEIDFLLREDVLIVTHTWVDEDLGGQGLARKLVLEVLSLAKEKQLRIQTSCSYVRGYFQRNPDSVFVSDYPDL